MLPKISFVYSRKGKRNVEASIYFAGKRRYLSTGVVVPENATYRNGIISGCTSAPALNKTLTTAMTILQGQLQEQIANDSFDLNAFSLAVTFNTGSFVDWATARIEKARMSDNTKSSHQRALTKFAKLGIVRFSDITAQALNKAVSAMLESGMNPTSISTYFGSLRSHIKAAYKEKLIARNPLPEVTLPKGQSATINYLTKEEVALLESLPLTGHKAMARDMFIFACYTGLAYSDLTKIKKKDVIYIKGKPHIIDKRKKTGGEYKLRMLPKAMEILVKYNYNLDLMNNSHANEMLLRIEKQISLPKHLSMHVGRHTFATLALSSGIRIETVSRMLAHSNIQTTQIYAKVLQKDVDDGFDVLEDKL